MVIGDEREVVHGLLVVSYPIVFLSHHAFCFSREDYRRTVTGSRFVEMPIPHVARYRHVLVKGQAITFRLALVGGWRAIM